MMGRAANQRDANAGSEISSGCLVTPVAIRDTIEAQLLSGVCLPLSTSGASHVTIDRFLGKSQVPQVLPLTSVMLITGRAMSPGIRPTPPQAGPRSETIACVSP